MTKTTFDKMTKRQKEAYREICSRAGKAGSKADKSRAGKLGVLARVEKALASK